jgi:hypothetical protein
VLLGANTTVHGFVPLMQQKVHMALAHEIRGFDALVFTFGFGDIR